MPRDFSRSARVSEVIQREVANVIQTEMNDPRVSAVTITYTKMTRDMSSAIVYFTLQSDDKKEIRETEKALNKAAGFIRHVLTERVELRYIPKLQFIFDESIERGRRVSKLIDDVIQREDGNAE
jgi:ribosome-binding factor A